MKPQNTNTESLNRWLDRLSPGLMLNEDRICTFVSNDPTVSAKECQISLSRDEIFVVFYLPLCSAKDEQLAMSLQMNFFLFETGGGALSLDPYGHSLGFNYRDRLEELQEQSFHNLVPNLFRLSSQLLDKLEANELSSNLAKPNRLDPKQLLG